MWDAVDYTENTNVDLYNIDTVDSVGIQQAPECTRILIWLSVHRRLLAVRAMLFYKRAYVRRCINLCGDRKRTLRYNGLSECKCIVH